METTTTADQFIANLPDDRRPVIAALHAAIDANLPKGFASSVGSGMISWVVPHQLYPAGYHCNPKQPLPFLSLASQKSHIALYHMGLYASPKLLEWFQNEWPKHSSKKLDMGKSCIRFKKAEDVPVQFLGELASKMSPQEWIEIYERQKPAGK